MSYNYYFIVQNTVHNIFHIGKTVFARPALITVIHQFEFTQKRVGDIIQRGKYSYADERKSIFTAFSFT